MRNKGITLVSLVVTIIVLILLAGVSLNLTLGENGIITMARKAKENAELAQMEEEKMLNELYTQIETDGGLADGLDYDAILKLYEFKKAIADYIEEAGGIKPDNAAETEIFGESIKGIVAEVTKDATATDKDILEGKTAWIKGNKITGTMPNRGNLNWNPNNATSYTLPAGYYSGGTISTANAYNAGVTNGRVGYYTKAQYDANYSAGYNAGRIQGQNDVKGSPNSYGLYTADQYNNRYNEGVSAGQALYTAKYSGTLRGVGLQTLSLANFGLSGKTIVGIKSFNASAMVGYNAAYCNFTSSNVTVGGTFSTTSGQTMNYTIEILYR